MNARLAGLGLVICFFLSLSACSSIPRLAELRAADVHRVTGYLKSSEVEDGAHFLDVLRYTAQSYEQIDARTAERSSGNGPALAGIYRKPPVFLNGDFAADARVLALRALAASPAEWATRELLALHRAYPANAEVRKSLIQHLANTTQWATHTSTGSEARLMLADLRAAGVSSELQSALSSAIATGFQLDGLMQDAARVPGQHVSFYAAYFAALAPQANAARTAPGFRAYHARAPLMDAPVAAFFADTFSAQAPQAFAETMTAAAAQGDLVLHARLLMAASKGKATNAPWTQSALDAVLAALPRSYRESTDGAVLFQSAVLAAASSPAGRTLVHGFAKDETLSADARAAALVGVTAAGEAVDAELLSTILNAVPDAQLQTALFGYVATQVDASQSDALVRYLSRAYRLADEKNPPSAVVFLEAFARALTAGNDDAALAGGATSIIRDTLRRDTAGSLARLQAYFSGLPADRLYRAVFSGISSAVSDATPAEKVELLEMLAALFGNAYAELGASEQSRVAALYAREIANASDQESLLRMSTVGLALAHANRTSSTRIREALDRQLDAHLPAAPAHGDRPEQARFDASAQGSFPFPGSVFARAREVATPLSLGRELIGPIALKAPPAQTTMAFGAPQELLLLPADAATYAVNQPRGTAIARALVFDVDGRLRYTRLPASADFPLDFSAVAFAAASGKPRLDAGGKLWIDGIDPVHAALNGITVTFGSLRGALNLQPEFSLSQPISLSADGRAGQAGSAGAPGQDGATGYTGAEGQNGRRGGEAGDGGDGSPGHDGQPGARGGDAGALYGAVRALPSSAGGERLFLVEFPAQGVRYVLPESAAMNLSARGGNGGAGGAGGRGGNGGRGGTGGYGAQGYAGQAGSAGYPGQYCTYQGCNCDGGDGGNGSPGGRGSDGGPGGDGGNGATGGNGAAGGAGGTGGNICLVFAGDGASRRALESRVNMDVRGGAHGAAGAAGAPGAAGWAGSGGAGGSGGPGGWGGPGGAAGSGYYTVFNQTTGYQDQYPLYCSSGSSGYNGSSGASGNPGRDGSSGVSGSSGQSGQSGADGRAGVALILAIAAQADASWPPPLEAITAECNAALRAR